MSLAPIDSLAPKVRSILKENSSVLKCDVELIVHCIPCGKDLLNISAHRLLSHLGLQRHLDYVEASVLYPEDQKARDCFASIADMIRRDTTRAEWLECRNGNPFCTLCHRILLSDSVSLCNHTRHHKNKNNQKQRSNLKDSSNMTTAQPHLIESDSLSPLSQDSGTCAQQVKLNESSIDVLTARSCAANEDNMSSVSYILLET